MRVKVCGIRRPSDALFAAELGASAVGFIFWPQSPRFIEAEAARAIIRDLPPFVTAVGVFVDQPRDYVLSVAARAGLSAVQLHGAERPEWYAGFPCRVIKAVPVDEGFSAAKVAAIPEDATVLLDAHDPILRGGTGKTIDWTRAAAVARQRPVILSGGLKPENVRFAIGAVKPHAVDVSSGVESAPGVKDADKLRRFFAALEQ